MNIVRAWKDPEYRDSLHSAPQHPAGPADPVSLQLADLHGVDGAGTERTLSFGCCNSFISFTLTVPISCAISLSIC
ncbi:hypothetical protein GCM10029964_029880 [Kibdelosporangium lantanae]